MNTEVSLKDVGEFMQEYAQERNIKDVLYSLLIGCCFGKKIRLSMPLLKWYLGHGLVITRTYTIVEYAPLPTFKNFMTEVAEAQLLEIVTLGML